MAYVNVKDWSVEQVTDWLKGLDSAVAPYIKSFLNNGVKGYQLLSLRADDLEHLGVITLGHQEIILEAVEHLRNFHYELDRENLQTLALKLSCAAHSLSKTLSITDDDCKMVPTQIMSDVHTVVQAGKPLVCWLDRSPFYGDKMYMDIKSQLLELSFKMATSAHRDIFSEKPLKAIRNISESLAELADNIIQNISDPMILQTAFLALATLKKKEQELGFFLVSSCSAAHQIVEIKYESPAHVSTKIEEGDEIVQVNYQTVVGWQRKKVLLLLQESPPEIVLTLKKRPRHTKVYGQIYVKPYRLPSKKRAMPYSRWNDNLSSPQLLAIHDLPQIPIPRPLPKTANNELESETSSSSDSEPLDSPLDGGGRVYPLKPRPVLQRRNTITGASPVSKRPYQAIEQYWQLLKNQAASKHASSYNIDSNKLDDEAAFLRDKSASCGYGLELSTRPCTVLGISQNKDIKSNINNFRKCLQEKPFPQKKVNFEDKTKIMNEENGVKKINIEIDSNSLDKTSKSVSVTSLSSLSETLDFIDESDDITDRSKMKNEWQKEIIEEIIDSINFDRKKSIDNMEPPKICKDESLSEVHVHSIIKKFDKKFSAPESSQPLKPKTLPSLPDSQKKPDYSKKPAVPPRNLNNRIRGTLNKSHSTPAYDLTEGNSDVNKIVNEPQLTEIVEKEDKSSKDESCYNVSGLSNVNIKYELGIPVVESEFVEFSLTNQKESHCDIISKNSCVSEVQQEINHDVPPKPPPRSSATILTYKPRYPDPVMNKPQKPEIIPVSTKAVDNFTSEKTVKEMKSQISIRPPVHHCSNNQHTPLPQEIQKYEIEFQTVDSAKQKSFTPSQTSTPVSKICKSEISDTSQFKIDSHKSSSCLEVHKVSHESKISPTNSVVRAFYSGRNKVSKKKNSLIAKRRKVSVKDVSPGEFQGYLSQRLRSKHSQNVHWEKRWFVLSSGNLYGFKSKEASKAECLIFLSGYTVSNATEVKSRTNAFKVYHAGTVFYFSAENSEMLTSWMEELSAATIQNDPCKDTNQGLYSETDDSDVDQKEASVSKPAESFKKFGSLKKLTPTKTFSASQSGSSSLDRKWFFNKSHLSSRNVQPVPTAQFRSYRKMPAMSNDESVSTGNFTSHVPNFSPNYQNEEITPNQNISAPNLVTDTFKRGDSERKKPIVKSKPTNYVHSSNPNLFDMRDLHVLNFHKMNPFQQNSDSLAGFVTLEELMNRRREEQKQNPNYSETVNMNLIQPDVIYGEISIRPRDETPLTEGKKEDHPGIGDLQKKKISRTVSEPTDNEVVKENLKSIVESPSPASETTSFCFGKRGSLKKRKGKKEIYCSDSYLKGNANEEIFKSSWPSRTRNVNKFLCVNSKVTQSEFSFANRKLLKQKEYSASATNLDHSCVEAVNEQFFENAGMKIPKNESSKKAKKVTKQHSFNSDRKLFKPFNSGECREKFWIDSLRANDKVSDKSTTKVKLKSAVQYTPMSLPLATDQKGKLNAKFAFELNLDEKSSKGSKSRGFFCKQNDGKKEKTFLGSPKLHRAVFKKNKGIDHSHSFDSAELHSTLYMENDIGGISEVVTTISTPPHMFPSADYPGLEYPPTFEPETYSLADPNSSISFLRKHDKSKKEQETVNDNNLFFK